MSAGQATVLNNLLDALQKAIDVGNVEGVQGYANAANQLTAALERVPD